MRRVSAQRIVFLLSVVTFSSYCLSARASMAPLKISISEQSPQILSCEDLHKIHHDLNNKSDEELRDHFYRKFRWTVRPAEAYSLVKYYRCRFPDENDKIALYLKRWVEEYERAMLAREAEERELSSAPIRLTRPSPKSPAGRIMGTLLDVNDARVAYARIKVEGPNYTWEGDSDDAGDFTAQVPAGTYRIYVTANGFRKFESAFLKVKPDVTEMVSIHLEVLPIIDTVPVDSKKKPRRKS